MATKARNKAGDGDKRGGESPGDSGRKRKSGRLLRVLVVRHAIAEDAAEFARTGAPDADRPLTRQGRQRMRKASQGLVQLVPDVHVIATSPLVRAVETAEILQKRYLKSDVEAEIVRLSALAPGKSSSLLLGWLAEQAGKGTVVLVGHEPHLGQFVSWALTGLRESFVEVKKGAAILLEFRDEIRPGRAKLLWSVRPKILRALSGSAD